jgi:hypothetical protein
MGKDEQTLTDNWIYAFITRLSYVAAYVCVEILLLLLAVAYHMERTPYSAGTYYVFFLYLGFLTALPWFLGQDFLIRLDEGLGAFQGSLTLMQASVVLVVVLANVAMTIVATVDVRPS